MSRGRLIVVAGPSGVGKSSIVDKVIEDTNSRYSVSATSKPPRPGERDGVDYHFMSRDSFHEAITDGVLLEWAEFAGHLYGTLRSEVDPALEAGVNVILNIEIEGAKQIRSTHPEAIFIFINPPSLEELRSRLERRGDTSPEDIERRFGVAEREIAQAPDVFDHIIVNDDLDDAIASVLDILAEHGTPVPGLIAHDLTQGDHRP
ncbi:MAG: guanylate kinase [Actinomycetia bacterium]|nr:guanylate kinase [Actinomycetes bacterium]